MLEEAWELKEVQDAFELRSKAAHIQVSKREGLVIDLHRFSPALHIISRMLADFPKKITYRRIQTHYTSN